MIDAKDLRIGNWFLFGELRHQATHWDIRNLALAEFKGNPLETYKPIPLTPEILEKCGFEKWGKDGYDKNGIYISKYFNYPIYNPFGEYINSIEVKYLHELQNLYYALTKQELNYTP